jgi:hypothetical protein
VNEQLVILNYLDLILQDARLVSEDNRAKLADLARRKLLPEDAIRELRAAGIPLPSPDTRVSQK